MGKKLILIFLFAFLIRLVAINQSLWLDEATTAQVVKQYSLLEIITKFSPKDFHPPLYYLLVKLWTSVFGYSEIALRMPSVIFSLATGWIIYLIGGVWASALFLFNPLIVYYSQEARMYMMATFFLTSALYFFIRLCHPEFISGSRNPYRVNKFGMTKLRDLFLFSLSITLSFVTFYGSAFLIAAFLLYFVYKKQYKNFFLATVCLLLTAILISPLLYKQLTNSKIALTQVANWSLVLGKANLKNLLLIPVKFVVGRIDFYPKWLYYSIAGIWTAFTWFFITKVGIKNKFLLFLLIYPMALGFLLSFSTPLLQYFRFLYLIPIISLLLAKSPPKKIITIGFIIFSFLYLLIPQFHREDWKSLTANLPEDKPIYMISSSSDPIKYYKPDLKINALTDLSKNELPKKLVVIPYTADIHGVDYIKILLDKKYRLVDKKTFRELELEEWAL